MAESEAQPKLDEEKKEGLKRDKITFKRCECNDCDKMESIPGGKQPWKPSPEQLRQWSLAGQIMVNKITGNPDVTPGLSAYDKLKVFMGQENLTILLPKLVADTHEALLTWVDKDQGVIEPFDLLRRLVFQLMLHVICIPEIADDKTFRSRNLGEQPWKGHRGKTDGLSHGSWLVTGVYEQMIRIMKQRIRRSRRRKKMEVKPPKMRREQKDVLHVLMKRPLDKFAIGSTITTTLVATLEEFGSPAAWVLCFIASDSAWYSHIQSEVDEALARYRTHDGEHPVDVCRRLSIADWATQFPSITVAMHDALRVCKIMVKAKRKNLAEMRAKQASEGGSATASRSCHIIDPTHIPDEEFNELSWDPAVYQTEYTWDAWPKKDYYYGRVAATTVLDKLIVTMTTVMFVAHYDYALCDEKGIVTRRMPKGLDHLDPEMPSGIYLQCKVRVPGVSGDQKEQNEPNEQKQQKQQKDPKQPKNPKQHKHQKQQKKKK